MDWHDDELLVDLITRQFELRPLAPPPDAYRVQDLARQGVIGRAKLFALIRSGELEARKLGSATVILRESWLAYLRSLPLVDRRKQEARRREAARVRRARVEQRAGAAVAPRIGASKRERGRR